MKKIIELIELGNESKKELESRKENIINKMYESNKYRWYLPIWKTSDETILKKLLEQLKDDELVLELKYIMTLLKY